MKEPEIPVPPEKPFDLYKNQDKPKPQASASESLDQVESLINAMRRANDVLQVELDTLGKTTVEREKGVALAKAEASARQAGRALTEEERTSIDQLAEAHAKPGDKLKDQQQALRQNAELMRYLGSTAADALGQIIFDGAKASDVLKSLAWQLGKSVLSAAFTGSGPLAGLFGTAAPASAGSNASGGLIGALGGLFGIGKNAEGTDNWRGGLSWVGERGPELVNLPRGAQVIPNNVLRGGSSGGGAGSISFGDTHISAPGGDPGQIAAMLDERDRTMRATLQAQLPAMIRNAQSRGQIR